MLPQAILIAGPTASGKSALALEVVKNIDGVIINADSMQVYHDLRVITARPSIAEENAAPHYLYGHVDGGDNYSVGRWLADVTPLLDELKGKRQVPVIVGGTGLYFKALSEGLSDIPPVPEDVRQQVRQNAEGRETPLLYADFAVRDPETAARISPTDRQRILRALEVLAATGRSLASFRSRKKPGPLHKADVTRLFIAPDRGELNQKIDARFMHMMEQGALAEVERLAARGLDSTLPLMRSHGTPWLIRHLQGEIGLDEAIAGAQTDTRHYAKRQLTWFRHQLPDFPWMTRDQAKEHLGLKR